ncbi:MAG: hypothetical protein ACOVS5_06260 [Oligoflexus sp.]|jgi:hypothetical protein
MFAFFSTACLLISLTILAGCSRLENPIDNIVLRCGEDALNPPSPLFWIDMATSERWDVSLLSGSKTFGVERTSKGCIRIPEGIPAGGLLFFRSAESKTGKAVDLNKISSKDRLIPLSKADDVGLLKPESLTANCSDKNQITQLILELNASKKILPVLTYSSYRYSIQNANQEIVQRGTLQSGDESIRLATPLADGNYTATINSLDVFEPNTSQQTSSCSFIIDRTAPQVSTSLDKELLLLPDSSIRRVAPGQIVALRSQDASGTKLSVCAKKRVVESEAATCDENEFQENDSIVAPASGVWDVYVYASDTAGNRSRPIQETFAVFRQEKIERLYAQLSLARASALLGKAEASYEALQQAQHIVPDLDLSTEREVIKWPYLEALWELDQLNPIRWRSERFEDFKRMFGSRFEDAFGVVRADGSADLYFDRKPLIQLPDVDRIDFADGHRYWTLSERGSLRAYEKNQLLFDRPTGLNKAGLRVSRSGQIAVIATEETIHVYNRNVGEPVFSKSREQIPVTFADTVISENGRFVYWSELNKISIVDLERDRTVLSFERADNKCRVAKIQPWDDRRFFVQWVWNTRQGNGTTSQPQNDANPCVPSLFEIENSQLKETSLKGRFSQQAVNGVAYFTVAGSIDRPYALVGSVSSNSLYFIDINAEEGEPAKLDLPPGDSLVSAIQVSSSEPLFFVVSNSGHRLVKIVSGQAKTLKTVVNENGNTCILLHQVMDIVCTEPALSPGPFRLRAYNLDLRRSWFPHTVITEDQVIQTEDFFPNWQDLVQTDPSSSLVAVASRASQNLEIYDRRGMQLQSLKFSFGLLPVRLKLRDKDSIAIGFEGGRVALSNGQEQLAYSPEGETLGEAAFVAALPTKRMMSLHDTAEGTQTLVLWEAKGSALEKVAQREIMQATLPINRIESQKESRAFVIFHADPPFLVEQEAYVLDAELNMIDQIRIVGNSVTWTEEGTGFYFFRDETLYFYDLSLNSERPIAPLSKQLNGTFVVYAEDVLSFSFSQLFNVSKDVKTLNFEFSFPKIGPQGLVAYGSTQRDTLTLAGNLGRNVFATEKIRSGTQITIVDIQLDQQSRELGIRYDLSSYGVGFRWIPIDLEAIQDRSW